MASKPRPVASTSSTRSDGATARSAVSAQRARTKRGLHQPHAEAKRTPLSGTSVAPNPVSDLSDLNRDDRLRRELQEGNGRSPRDRQREHLSAANEEGVLEEDDPDVAEQRRAQSIDEQAADSREEDQK